MIRLPTTGISLSERDIDFHLHQAQLIHALRKQGFKKDDVARYLKEHHAATAQAAYPYTNGLTLTAPSTVELSLNRPYSSSTSDTDPTTLTGQESGHSSSVESTSESSVSFPDLPPDLSNSHQATPKIEGLSRHKNQDASDDGAVSPDSMPPTMLINQHAPRKSSLLRFAQVASPERCPTGSGEEPILPVVVATPRARKYRRRSTTYPHQSSERESTVEVDIQHHVLEGMNRMSLEDESLAAELETFSMPPPHFTSVRTSSASDLQFASPVTGDGSEPSPVVTFMRPTLNRRRSSSLFGPTYSTADIPSSPPLPRTPARQHARRLESSSGSPQLPTRPTPIRDAGAFPRTEPRHYRHQLDGNSFSVYNDSLPSVSQPQTPADLSRQPLITEHEAAYTAPPGMIRSAHGGRNVWQQEPGEQSPTARAITMRERRNRELTRSVRAEEVRLNRLRMRDEAMFTQRAIQPAAAANGGLMAETMLAMGNDVWMEDLDADRVGEENFEAEAEVNGRRVMRTVSGNARFDAWEGAMNR